MPTGFQLPQSIRDKVRPGAFGFFGKLVLDQIVHRDGVSRTRPGGQAFNTACALRSASSGDTVRMLGLWPDDRSFVDEMKRRRIELSVKYSGNASLVEVRVDDAGERHLRRLSEATSTLQVADVEQMNFTGLAHLHLDGRDLKPNRFPQAVIAARRRGGDALVSIDSEAANGMSAHGGPDAFWAKVQHLAPDMFFCSENEADALGRRDDWNRGKLGGVQMVIEHRGPGASRIYVANGVWEVPVERLQESEIVDLLGCGDAMTAGTILGVNQGLPDIEPFQLGHRLAAQVARNVGAQLPIDPYLPLR